MSDTLDRRVAIVTGGARGIGLAVAQTLAMEGARVVVADNGCAIDGGPEDCVVVDAAVDRLNAKSPGCAVAYQGDLASAGAAHACVTLALETFGALDIVVNNAAILREAPIYATDPGDIEAVIRNNLVAPHALLAAATPVMREQARSGRIPGAIVNMVATAGFIGNHAQGAFAASKAGLIGLTRVVAMDMAGSGVTCNAVAPFAATRVTQAQQPATETQRESRDHALRVPASYVANLVAYLCTTYASRVTGQLFGVRGREVFLYHPPVPEMTVFTHPGGFDAEQYAQFMQGLRGKYADLRSDVEVFNFDPIL